jgi:DtxR family Mn-dependent transcriptional regulator
MVTPLDIAARLGVRAPSVTGMLKRLAEAGWSEVDAEAEALEHAISPRLEQALAAHLGEPVLDPHGHPIPTREGKLTQRALQPIGDFPAGRHVVIREVNDDNPARLRRWQQLGLVPGAVVHILSYQPLDSLFELEVGGKVVHLGREGLIGLRGEADVKETLK